MAPSSACNHSRSSLQWVTAPHPSGSLHLPGRERLAKVCNDCGKILCYSHSEHCDLVLDLYRPAGFKKR